MHARIRMPTYVRACVHAHIHAHVHAPVHRHIYMHMYICIIQVGELDEARLADGVAGATAIYKHRGNPPPTAHGE